VSVLRAVPRYGFVARIAARQQWVYRGELWMRSIAMVLFMGVFMALWNTAFHVSGESELAGYSLVEVVWYLAMTETITLSTSRAFVDISDAVKSGDLAYTLTRPVSYPFFQIAHSLGNSLPRLGLNLLTASAVVALGVGVGAGSLPGIAAFFVTGVLALLLDALIAVLIGLSAFWIEEVMPIFWIYQKLLFTVGGLFLPLEMLPSWLRRISMWLPFRYVANVPARVFVAFEWHEALGAALGQVAYIAVLTIIVLLVWRLAQRRMVVHGG
jgi:ABC-2 type transport system permease protein